jgi:hypothetical protein
LLILNFDGVVTKLNIDGVEVHGEVSRAVGFRVDSLLYFWDKHFSTEVFSMASRIVER